MYTIVFLIVVQDLCMAAPKRLCMLSATPDTDTLRTPSQQCSRIQATQPCLATPL